MSAEIDLVALLNADSGLTAVVGSRVYPAPAPSDVRLPCVVYRRTGTEYLRSISGAVLGSQATLEVVALADERRSAETLADTVVTALSGTAFELQGRAADDAGEGTDGLDAVFLTISYWE